MQSARATQCARDRLFIPVMLKACANHRLVLNTRALHVVGDNLYLKGCRWVVQYRIICYCPLYVDSPIMSISDATEMTMVSGKHVHFTMMGEVDRVQPPYNQFIYKTCGHCKHKAPAHGPCTRASCVGLLGTFSYGKRLSVCSALTIVFHAQHFNM